MDADLPHLPQPQAPGGVFVRRADADDAAFVFSYWLRDYFERSRFAKGISKGLFMQLHHLLLERIIARSTIWIACDPEMPAIAYGFICSEADTLHYLYVKRRFRRMGIGGLLLTAAGMSAGPKDFTHLTDEGVGLRRKFPLAEYNPYKV